MSLGVTLTEIRPTEVFSANITHNLVRMAQEAGIYSHLWRPEEIGIDRAGQLIQPLTEGLALLRWDRQRFEKFQAANGWGRHEDLVRFVERYLEACRENPEAKISVSR